MLQTPLIHRLQGLSAHATFGLAALFILVICAVDVFTGMDVRVLSLYLVPVAGCAWRLERVGAILGAAMALAAWAVAQHLSGVRHWSTGIWTFNLLSQGLAMLSIGWLVAVLSRRLAIERLASHTDPLTSLRNRRGLMEDSAMVLAMCKRHGRPLAIALIDLDNFKQLNDRFGHDRGDAVLVACAGTLTAHSRGTNLTARLGGDEFVVLMPETDHDQAVKVLERLRAKFLVSEPVAGTGVDMTIGLHVDEGAEHDLDALIAMADARMYAAKRGGKGRVSG